MLILDPKSGQSIAVDLTVKPRPFLAAIGSQDPRKVPAENKKILASLVSFDLQSMYKTTRHSWVASNDEYNKNKPALCVHTGCLHHSWTCTWDDSTQEP